MKHDDCYRLHFNSDGVNDLYNDLRTAGFDATLLDGTFRYEDLDTDQRVQVATIELPESLDKIQLRTFLREQGA